MNFFYLRIKHNGKSIKDGWFIDYIEIYCNKLKQSWKFICNRWLSNHRPPNYKNSITLTSINETLANEKLLNTVEYFLLIKTGDRPLPASDLNVQFQFVGSKAQSVIFNLISPYNSCFEPNQLDAFLITCSSDLGKPEKLRMALEHNDRKFPFEWFIEELKIIYSKEPNKFYTFRLDRWVEKNHKLNGN